MWCRVMSQWSCWRWMPTWPSCRSRPLIPRMATSAWPHTAARRPPTASRSVCALWRGILALCRCDESVVSTHVLVQSNFHVGSHPPNFLHGAAVVIMVFCAPFRNAVMLIADRLLLDQCLLLVVLFAPLIFCQVIDLQTLPLVCYMTGLSSAAGGTQDKPNLFIPHQTTVPAEPCAEGALLPLSWALPLLNGARRSPLIAHWLEHLPTNIGSPCLYGRWTRSAP